MCYNTTFNTMGIGNAVPAGNTTTGSGDKFDNSLKKDKKKKSKQKSFSVNELPNIVYLKK